MKKNLLLSLAAFAAVGSAFASAPNHLWTKLLDSAQTSDIPSAVAVASDGNPVVLAFFGSRSEGDFIAFDGATIGVGAATSANSDNSNLLVTKHDAKDGSLKWAVSSSQGDFSNTASNAIATADGGVIVLVNTRVTVNSPASYIAPVLKDAAGKEVELTEFNTSDRVYNQVLVKIDANGNIEWARNIAQDQLPVPNATATSALNITSQGVTPYALAEDAEGNIYIGGNYRTPIIFTGNNYSSYVLTPRNVENYSGDVQSAAGGLYIVRLDKDGNYLGHVRAKGELTRDQATQIVVDGSTLYFLGNIQGEGKTLTVGDKSVSATSSFDGVVVGSLSTDLSTVNYLTYLQPFGNSANKSVIQLKNLCLIDGKLFVIGALNGGLGAADASAAAVQSAGTALDGFFVALDAETGAWSYAADNSTSVGGYYEVFPYDGKLYAYGYRLNAATGLFLDEYEPGNATYSNRYTLATQGGAPTAYGAAFDASSKNVYFLGRGNKAFTLADGSATDAPTSWGSLVGAYTWGDASSAIAAEADAKSLSIEGGKGVITVNASTATDIQVVNTLGQTVNATTVAAGATSIAVTPGIYLVNDVKVLVK